MTKNRDVPDQAGSLLRKPGAYPDMDYLATEAARTRCVIAAHFVRECPHVVEIGGFTTPVSLYLTGVHESVTVFDPLMRDYEARSLNGAPCRVRHISRSFQDSEVEVEPGSYGLVMLGASLKHFSDDPSERERQWLKLTGIVERARVAVIEAAVDWHLGKSALDRLGSLPSLRTRVHLDMDLRASPGMDTDHYRRRLLVLSPR